MPLANRLVVCGAVWLLTGALSAEDWPDFRGPTGQGISRSVGLPVDWSPERNVAWKQAIPGSGWSSPVCVGDRIYLTTAVEEGEPKQLSLRTLCFSAGSGKLHWNIEVFRIPLESAPRIHSKNSHASPTPIVSGDRVFVHFGHHGTACLGPDGAILWKNVSLSYAPVHGNGGTPALVDDKLVFSCDGASDPFVVALDVATGNVRWRVPRNGDAVKKFAFSTPLVITVGGQKQIISPGSNSVGAFDPNDGREIWRVNYEGYSVIPRPVYGQGLIFISTGYDSPEVLAIRPDGAGDVTETHVAWRLKKGAPHTPSLLLHADELYMVSDRGVATCVDARTGTEVWQHRVGGNYSASPVLADGRIYFQSESGDTTVIRPGRTYQEVATSKLGEPTLASYAIADGAIFIRTGQHLYRIEKRGPRS